MRPKKLLRPQDIILLVLSGAFDLIETIYQPRFHCYYDILRGWVPKGYKKQNLFMTVSRAMKAGYIEKIIRNGKPYFRLTGVGKRKLVRDFSIFRFAKKKWDGKWVVVMFDVAEIERWVRDNLRNKLIELGFGMYQKSVYISPHSDLASDLAEFLTISGLKEMVQVMVGPWFLIGDEKALAERVFKLDKINRAYEKILDEWGENKEVEGKRREILMRNLRIKYLNILANDPFLPKELLPDDWVGEETRRLIVTLK